MDIVINSIKKESVVDGPGIRTVLFMQGCNIKCVGCHNKASWDINKGIKRDIKHLVIELTKVCINKKITISGGEPLMQKESLKELIKQLNGFDVALYTSYNDVDDDIKDKISYLKTGKFVLEEKTTVKPFVGSNNQEFRRVK
ncbi:MAG: 4Fe-4S cluster-binding domain-containing protein [bacterium]